MEPVHVQTSVLTLKLSHVCARDAPGMETYISVAARSSFVLLLEAPYVMGLNGQATLPPPPIKWAIGLIYSIRMQSGACVSIPRCVCVWTLDYGALALRPCVNLGTVLVILYLNFSFYS